MKAQGATNKHGKYSHLVENFHKLRLKKKNHQPPTLRQVARNEEFHYTIRLAPSSRRFSSVSGYTCLSFCPQEGGCTRPTRDIPPGQTRPGRQTDRPGLGRHSPRRADPPRDGYCSGRYASYWNAFLLDNISCF